jgi:hypothetical protein
MPAFFGTSTVQRHAVPVMDGSSGAHPGSLDGSILPTPVLDGSFDRPRVLKWRYTLERDSSFAHADAARRAQRPERAPSVTSMSNSCGAAEDGDARLASLQASRYLSRHRVVNERGEDGASVGSKHG